MHEWIRQILVIYKVICGCTEYYSRYIEVSAAIPGDYGAALFLRLWNAFEGAWRAFFLSFYSYQYELDA